MDSAVRNHRCPSSGINGIDLATMQKAHYPQVRVSLFSGRAETTDLLEIARQQGHSFDVIAKPVHPTVFLGMLASEPLDDAGLNTHDLD
jgi:hypothetical protein